MNPVLLPEKQGTTILLQLHVSIQQSGEQLLSRSPLFVLILSAVYPFAAGWISDIPAASGSPQSFPSWKAPAPLPVLPDSIGQAGLRNIELLHCMADGAGAGNSRDIAELLKGHGSFLSACFFYPTAEPPKTQRIFFFEIPNEHCRHIQDTFYPPCNFPYNSTAVLKRLQHSHITKEAFRYGTTAK